MTIQDPMLDFVVFHLASSSTDISIYQGNHPDVPRDRTRVDFYPALTFERFQYPDGSWSYLVNPNPEGEGWYFLHFFGSSFDGTENDKVIFDRFLYDDRGHIFCAGPASNRY